MSEGGKDDLFEGHGLERVRALIESGEPPPEWPRSAFSSGRDHPFAARPRHPARRVSRFVLKVLCAPFPDRVANEEMGDALERIQELARQGRGMAYFARATAIVTGTLFGMTLNSLREIRGRWTRRRGGGHG